VWLPVPPSIFLSGITEMSRLPAGGLTTGKGSKRKNDNEGGESKEEKKGGGVDLDEFRASKRQRTDEVVDAVPDIRCSLGLATRRAAKGGDDRVVKYISFARVRLTLRVMLQAVIRWIMDQRERFDNIDLQRASIQWAYAVRIHTRGRGMIKEYLKTVNDLRNRDSNRPIRIYPMRNLFMEAVFLSLITEANADNIGFWMFNSEATLGTLYRDIQAGSERIKTSTRVMSKMSRFHTQIAIKIWNALPHRIREAAQLEDWISKTVADHWENNQSSGLNKDVFGNDLRKRLKEMFEANRNQYIQEEKKARENATEAELRSEARMLFSDVGQLKIAIVRGARFFPVPYATRYYVSWAISDLLKQKSSASSSSSSPATPPPSIDVSVRDRSVFEEPDVYPDGTPADNRILSIEITKNEDEERRKEADTRLYLALEAFGERALEPSMMSSEFKRAYLDRQMMLAFEELNAVKTLLDKEDPEKDIPLNTKTATWALNSICLTLRGHAPDNANVMRLANRFVSRVIGWVRDRPDIVGEFKEGGAFTRGGSLQDATRELIGDANAANTPENAKLKLELLTDVCLLLALTLRLNADKDNPNKKRKGRPIIKGKDVIWSCFLVDYKQMRDDEINRLRNDNEQGGQQNIAADELEEQIKMQQNLFMDGDDDEEEEEEARTQELSKRERRRRRRQNDDAVDMNDDPDVQEIPLPPPPPSNTGKEKKKASVIDLSRDDDRDDDVTIVEPKQGAFESKEGKRNSKQPAHFNLQMFARKDVEIPSIDLLNEGGEILQPAVIDYAEEEAGEAQSIPRRTVNSSSSSQTRLVKENKMNDDNDDPMRDEQLAQAQSPSQPLNASPPSVLFPPLQPQGREEEAAAVIVVGTEQQLDLFLEMSDDEGNVEEAVFEDREEKKKKETKKSDSSSVKMIDPELTETDTETERQQQQQPVGVSAMEIKEEEEEERVVNREPEPELEDSEFVSAIEQTVKKLVSANPPGYLLNQKNMPAYEVIKLIVKELSASYSRYSRASTEEAIRHNSRFQWKLWTMITKADEKRAREQQAAEIRQKADSAMQQEVKGVEQGIERMSLEKSQADMEQYAQNNRYLAYRERMALVVASTAVSSICVLRDPDLNKSPYVKLFTYPVIAAVQLLAALDKKWGGKEIERVMKNQTQVEFLKIRSILTGNLVNSLVDSPVVDGGLVSLGLSNALMDLEKLGNDLAAFNARCDPSGPKALTVLGDLENKNGSETKLAKVITESKPDFLPFLLNAALNKTDTATPLLVEATLEATETKKETMKMRGFMHFALAEVMSFMMMDTLIQKTGSKDEQKDLSSAARALTRKQASSIYKLFAASLNGYEDIESESGKPKRSNADPHMLLDLVLVVRYFKYWGTKGLSKSSRNFNPYRSSQELISRHCKPDRDLIGLIRLYHNDNQNGVDYKSVLRDHAPIQFDGGGDSVPEDLQACLQLAAFSASVFVMWGASEILESRTKEVNH
jgi:hypothetical protein